MFTRGNLAFQTYQDFRNLIIKDKYLENSDQDQSKILDWLDLVKVKISKAQKPIGIVGQNSKSFYGNSLDKNTEILDTTKYTGIVNYDPSELVVVVRSGTSIIELEKALKEKNQTLGFDPPRFSISKQNSAPFLPGGTVGGMVATGLSGPQRIFYGSCREGVLGLSVVNSDGKILKFGGTVIKNVAGYDVSRLHVGAMGTLGLILDVSLRVKPIPVCEETIVIPCKYNETTKTLEDLFSNHLPISSTSWTNIPVTSFFDTNMLVVKLSGAKSAVVMAKEFIFKNKTESLVVEKNKANLFWNSLRDQRFDFFNSDLNKNLLWRISLPFGCDFPFFSDITQWIEWGGSLRWIRTDEDPQWIFSTVKKIGGNAMIYKIQDHNSEIKERFHQPGLIEKELHKKIKGKMDPKFIFNPGRLYSFL